MNRYCERLIAAGVLCTFVLTTAGAQTATKCVSPIGTAPTGITVAAATTVVVQWNAVAKARGYAVARRNPDGTCWNLTPAGSTATFVQEPIPATPGTYQYQVAVQASTGAVGVSQWVPFTVVAPSAPPSAPPSTPLAPPREAPPAVLTPVAVLSDGPPPTSLAARGTPTSATVTWAVVPGATGYRVNRAPAGTTTYTVVTSAPITTTTLSNDPLPDWRQTYTYQVVAYQANGHYGAATINFTPPAATDPTRLSAAMTGPGSVRLSWQAAPGASAYLVSGPGIPSGTQAAGTSFSIASAPAGSNVYRVASVFTPGGVLTAAAGWPSVTALVSPRPNAAFLSIRNGAGSQATMELHNSRAGFCGTGGGLSWNCETATPGRSLASLLNVWGAKEEQLPALNLLDIYAQSIAFADTADLGLGRRVWCGTRFGTICVASSHGLSAGRGGPNEARRLADAAALNTESRGFSVIIKQLPPNATKGQPEVLYFLNFAFPPGFNANSEPDPAKRFVLQLNNAYPTASTLDSQGAKFSPHVCLACHGGRFGTGDGLVAGGALLPLDPTRLAFSGVAGASRAELESRINSFNFSVADPCELGPCNQQDYPPMLREYVRKLYGPGSTSPPARDDLVPAGWSTQAVMWRAVIRPYCITCHMTQVGPLAFSTWTDLVSVKDLVQKTVCLDGTMPHAEPQFRRFWSSSNRVSLPGFLSTALGFPSCP